MKRILFLIGIILCSHLPQAVKAQEYYFKFSENDKEFVNTKITRTVSIDRVEDDTIFAYANQKEFEALKTLGYLPELLKNPTLAIKNRGMASTIDQMANWDKYPTYEVYRSMMKKFEQDYPELCKLDSIGTTVQGRRLYVVKISDNVLDDEAEPELFYTSTMHGDETTGYVLMLRLIDYLLSNYETDSRVTEMVDNLAIFINPNANPDGTYYSGNHTVDYSRRYNANNVDINRNFPDPRVGENPDGNSYQPETVAMMEYADSRNFVLSANFHGGTELANFPWDTWNTATNAHADHNWFYTISRQYADLAQDNSPSGYFTAMNDGVTQGGDWYVITGGRQDYMNYQHNCREITLEISNTKNPASSTLPNYWNYNQEAMLSHIEWLYTGIQGIVSSTEDDPLDAVITIENHDKDNSFMVTNPINGNYIRMIEPGTYYVNYGAEGYISQTHSISIGSNTAQVIKDVVLVQAGQTILSGVVTDGETDNPISGAKIELLNSSISPVFSNSSGQYSFISIPENTYQIKVSKEEYLSQVITQTLTGESNTLNFSLAPSNAESFETDVPQGFTFTGGDWVRNNSTAFDGTYSMKSAPISNNQTTAMLITLDIVSDSEITFAYKVSSESGWDHLRFYVDGNEKGEWSGAINWTEVIFPVTAGNHTFKWEYSKDYSSSSGSDCAWIDYIIFPQSQNDVAFTVTYNNTPVQDATVTFNETSINTNASGKAIFGNQTRGTSGQYIVEKDGFITTTGSVEVKYIDINKLVNLEAVKYSVYFAVSNGTNPIGGATISINSQQLETNAQGEADIELPNGTYSYSVSMDGYHTQTGSIWVNEDDANVSIALVEETEPVYNVTFYVYDEEQDVENAIVTFTGRQGITDTNGECIFGGVAPGTYPYTITCVGYNDTEGSVIVVSEDVTEVIPLVIANNIAIETSISSLSLWPNPFTQYLNIRLNLNRSTDVKIIVYSIAGQKLVTIANEHLHQGEHQFHWNPSSAGSGMVQGVYFIRVITNQGERAERVIFSDK